MNSSRTTERQQAHELLDMLSDDQLDAVRSLLAVMVEPLSVSLMKVPFEAEEITPETADVLDRAKESLARGEGIDHKDILREFDLKH